MKKSKIAILNLLVIVITCLGTACSPGSANDVDGDYRMKSRDGFFLSHTKYEDVYTPFSRYFSNRRLKDAVATYLGSSQYDLGREFISHLHDYMEEASPEISCIDPDSGTEIIITTETPPGLFADEQSFPCNVTVTFEPTTFRDLDCIFWRDAHFVNPGDDYYHACYLQHYLAHDDTYTVTQILLKPDAILDDFYSMDIIRISGTTHNYVSYKDLTRERFIIESLESASLLEESPVYLDGFILGDRIPALSDLELIYSISEKDSKKDIPNLFVIKDDKTD